MANAKNHTKHSLLLALVTLLLWLIPASSWAQNPQCPTRPLGDSSNACASTAFVSSAISYTLPPTTTADQILLSGASTVPSWSTYAFPTSVASGCILQATSSTAISCLSVSLTSLATVANNTVIGNVSGSTAAPIALSNTQATTLINPFTSSLSGAVPASGGGTTNFLRADGTFASPGSSSNSCTNATSIGFVGNGSTANDTAFANWWASLPTTGGCIQFSPGIYVFSSQVANTYSGTKESISIIGAGSGATIFRWPNTNGGFQFTSNNKNNVIHLSGFSVQTTQVNSGTGIYLIGAGASVPVPSSTLTDIVVTGTDLDVQAFTGSDYWNVGIRITTWANFTISAVNTSGPYTYSGSGGGTGILIEGNSTSTTYTTIVNIVNSSFNFHTYGAYLGSCWQGVYFNQVQFNGQTGSDAIYAPTPAGSCVNALLSIVASQLNYAGTQINVSNVNTLLVLGDSIYCYSNGCSGILSSGGSALQATNNLFSTINGSPTGTYGIATSGSWGNVGNNIFTGLVVGVNLLSGSNNYVVSQDVYISVGTHFVNSGTTNNVGGAVP
jgi:hypothetical protein